VAPVVEKGATSRRVYLPAGSWFDFWTDERVEGGREIDRAVDLTTTPIYVRAGAVLPMGPVKQFTAQPGDGPLSVTMYPGADGRLDLFEDDGTSFEYRRGNWMGMSMAWEDRRRRLTVSLTEGSRMRPPLVRDLEVRVAGQKTVQSARFSGRPLVIAPGS
jgi:alpha-glucosidase (family GH31 glycosyl hydrolase)